MFYDTDIDLFFTDFAVDALYVPDLGTASTIKVIFDNNHAVIELLGEGAGVESTAPVAVCKTADTPDIKRNEILEIDETTYYVKTVEEDGTGMTKLILSEDEANV